MVAAYVMVESRRAWKVALVGPPEAVLIGTPAWETMVSTFRLAGTHPTPPARAVVGLPAPGFPALDHVKGPVIINFFATWCSDCRTDMPAIARAAIKSGGRFTVIGVACCGDKRSAVPGFLKELNVQDQFRVIAYDDGRIVQAYALLGPPTTAFLDKDHVLRQIVAGPVTPADLDRGLKDAGIS